LVDEHAPITLFLDRLRSLVLETVHPDGRSDRKELRRTGRGAEKSTFGRSLTIEEVELDRQRYLVGRMEVDEAAFRKSVQRGIDQSYPIERWKEWKGVPTVSVALPMSQDAREGNFYAFLPMDTVSPFNGCLDAPFHPDANRRDLNLDNPLNDFLLDSVADLCLAVARTIAATDTSLPTMSAAVVDALAWTTDPKRMLDACERAGLEVGEIQLPSIRRREGQPRWAPLSEIYDWSDANHRTISGQWLARACDVPMLRRALGKRRVDALREFVDHTDYQLDPSGSVFAAWAPLLAADLSRRRRKATRQSWEDFYADLAALPSALPHMHGMSIFRLEDGSLGAANSPETLDERELFISADPDNATRRRKRLAGTSLFPPRSVAQRMYFADPVLSWPPAVTAAFVDAGLASEFSLPRVIAGMGRLLGKRPSRQTATAAVGWAFTAWKGHKSTELEKALPISSLPVPTVAGKLRPASTAKFGSGWRDTSGDLLSELCQEIGSTTRGTKNLSDSLLLPWEEWPLRDRGTAAEWVQFLRLLGVRDGLTPVYYKAVSQNVSNWRWLLRGGAPALAVEGQLGETWRAALAKAKPAFGYISGDYSTGETLFALPLQLEHAEMNDRAKRAYARLAVRVIPELAVRHFTTTLNRTAGMSDAVPLPSPLLAFLTEAQWLPVNYADQVSWRRPRECWFASRAETLPRFLPRLERPIRDAIDANAGTREVFSERLGLRLWNERRSAVARLTELGNVLERRIA
jgi:hypothetical protein